MLKLYEGEVLNKLPVVQHLVFGSLIRCTWTPSSTIHLPTPPPHAIPTSFPASSLPGSGSFPAATGVRHHGSPPSPSPILLSSLQQAGMLLMSSPLQHHGRDVEQLHC